MVAVWRYCHTCSKAFKHFHICRPVIGRRPDDPKNGTGK